MAGTLKYFADRPLVYLKFAGETYCEDCVDAQKVLNDTPGWTPNVGCLIDYSEMTNFRSGYIGLQQVSAEMAASGHFDDRVMPLVYFAPTDLGFGVARMAQQILSPQLSFDIRVFREEAPALAFLGQPETRVSDLFAATQ
ncbi:hypothetical protein [Salipiger sp. PrR002]|uniref:hypothetical protein n=1 Tax=Salipiger sp. PrR002 TaxID=2706489 RepID=UPI0013BB1390|nr:hypothetical protein [Salipiger sp. PrR002]NDV98121.1 hypothetical protein [Salipiger sp. PrR002]NDW57096.1 hypothetical protein [Salipiger sp. PrR004]